MVQKSDGFIGVVDVCIHRARDIHNICIYHKQDVYAKFWMSIDPDRIVTTQIVNGGGMNPVFDENLRLNVRTIDSSVTCEIWMLSRIRNYLEDQMLGYALVSISDVLAGNGRLAKEFALSSSNVIHSPAGFVELTLSYAGNSPDVLEIPARSSSLSEDVGVQDSDCWELDKIEFPDARIVNENHLMVSEYFGIPNVDLDSQISLEISEVQSHPSNVSTNGSPPYTYDTGDASHSPIWEKVECIGEAENVQPVIGIKIEEEPKLVQAEIVDMYLKSMQQFTESLAKMKLPMDIDNGPMKAKNVNYKVEKLKESKSNGSRLFYGSNAFF